MHLSQQNQLFLSQQMKLLLRLSNQRLNHAISKACCCSRSLFTSTPSDNLRVRISRAVNLNASVVTVLEQWLDEGKTIKLSHLQSFIKMVRKFGRHGHALQISEWMSDEWNHTLSLADIAIRLDLISRVRGLEEADKYFESIPENMRDYRVYGALLSCYVQTKSLEKSEALMKNMIELGYAKNSFPYNTMLSLYSNLQKYKELDDLIQEMGDRGVDFSIFTYNIRLNAYAAVGDVEKMEQLLMTAEIDPLVSIDIHTYITAANGYLKAGETVKALTLLKKTEHLVNTRNRKFAYKVLMSLYASAGNKDELNRIWILYKQLGIFYNSGYLTMISSLVKLRDIDAAERIYKEWESKCAITDVRVPNALIMGWCCHGRLEKAEALVNRLLESCNKPNAYTWNHLATGYMLHGQMAKAVEAIKKALLLSQIGREINFITLTTCLDYVKGQGGEEAEEEILSLIKNSDFSPSGYIVRTSNGEKLGSGEPNEFSEPGDERIDIDTDNYMEVKQIGCSKTS